MNKRKIFVIDTSVLLYDKTSIHSFDGNDVVLPLKVVDELDRFKDKPGIVGEASRYVNRYLDSLRKQGRLDQETLIEENDQTIRIHLQVIEPREEMSALDLSSGDNQILGAALYVAEHNPDRNVIVVTKDINLRVKCDALGLSAEDYYKDHIHVNDQFYTGFTDLEVDDNKIDLCYDTGEISIEDLGVETDLNDNHFINLFSNIDSKKSFLGVYKSGKIFSATNKSIYRNIGIEPKNKEQNFALYALNNDNIQMVSLTGIAGSGKTFLTLLSAVQKLTDKVYKRIIFTRTVEPVGKDLGYLPGDINEKMAPWLNPLIDNFVQGFGDKTYFELMREKGKIEIAPLSYMRGRTFNDAFVIVDEAQNATIHELKTVLTRIGKGSKVVLLGDTDQIDTPYIDKDSNGLTITVEKFKSSDITAHIRLSKGQRSRIAGLAAKIL